MLTVGVEQTLAGGNSKFTPVGNVPVGTPFSYVIQYQQGVLSVAINGGMPTVLSTYQLYAPKSYFKVGNYNQGNTASDVHFYTINVQH